MRRSRKAELDLIRIQRAREDSRRAAMLAARAARYYFLARLRAADPRLVDDFRAFLKGYTAPIRWQALDGAEQDTVRAIENALSPSPSERITDA